MTAARNRDTARRAVFAALPEPVRVGLNTAVLGALCRSYLTRSRWGSAGHRVRSDLPRRASLAWPTGCHPHRSTPVRCRQHLVRHHWRAARIGNHVLKHSQKGHGIGSCIAASKPARADRNGPRNRTPMLILPPEYSAAISIEEALFYVLLCGGSVIFTLWSYPGWRAELANAWHRLRQWLGLRRASRSKRGRL